jgi:hypothetical protein
MIIQIRFKNLKGAVKMKGKGVGLLCEEPENAKYINLSYDTRHKIWFEFSNNL